MESAPLRIGAFAVLIGLPLIMVVTWVHGADQRLKAGQEATNAEPAVATATDERYCSVELKRILRRVLQSCGLLGRQSSRGCQPLQAKQLATVSGSDFNALFKPMRERGGIVQFDAEQSELDDADEQLIDQVFAEQRGASYFFVVARASLDGPVAYNRQLSKARAEAVLGHLVEESDDPDLEREVGLLWLGEEYAQLGSEFCDWRRSGESGSCRTSDINRGAFIAWIDCRL
jgi:outer membrane protein OmpA-like peptidoglycan-associated protein